jgi:ubiquinone/menaquinone biosynthesis C-methylase UbiE/glycosyltransferase involved in cell wall biosynthesis
VAAVYEYILGPLIRAVAKQRSKISVSQAPPIGTSVSFVPKNNTRDEALAVPATNAAPSAIETPMSSPSLTSAEIAPAVPLATASISILKPIAQDYLATVERLINNASPIPMATQTSETGLRISGKGVYLRTDFWAAISSGGSYGHTCYVAKELDNVSDGLVCFLSHRYILLDALGLHQVALPSFQYIEESSLLDANVHYDSFLMTAVEAVRPAFIYERICLGNYCGAKLSQEFEIPYIVEYNGSEIMMKWSFDGAPYQYEECYLAAETAAFAHATLISVVSKPIKDDLVKRGVPPSKIIVNPNGVDVEAYSAVPSDVKLSMRRAFGWGRSERIVGFTGTFGGWHGIDVLAEALPKICRRAPQARFLLIGDGQYKKLVDDAILKNRIQSRVLSTGRVPQQQGALLLRVCDIYISPHSRHMVGSRFFGSPTKIFEYMAMGGGIAASDLEQTGQVLSPALRASELSAKSPIVSNQRSVLCKPGSVEEFVDAVEFLVQHPDICEQLGGNARRAVEKDYSCVSHVQRLCKALSGDNTVRSAPSGVLKNESIAESRSTSDPEVMTCVEDDVVACSSGRGESSITAMQNAYVNDSYKLEVQKQWDNDPCGSHYVNQAEPHTLEWFLEAESYRYRDYAPWMLEVMEFDQHRGERVLEIGGGMGTDLSQFARNGAVVTDVDLSAGHLKLAQENFRLRGLEGEFIHHDAENLPLEDNSFDVVYSNGVIHHTPNTTRVIEEMFRVLRPGGRLIVMVYAENSWHYWYELVYGLGLARGLLRNWSIGEIMSGHAEISKTGARPLVKVYTARQLRKLFRDFVAIEILRRQLTPLELPALLRKVMSVETAGKLMGWNLIVKAQKPTVH